MAHRLRVEKGRVSLQGAMVKGLTPPGATGDIPVWLFIVDPGLLRVLSQQEIGEVRDLLGMNEVDLLSLETQEERARVAGFRMRFIETSIIPERRLKIPSEAFDVCGENLDRSHVWIEHTASNLDIYTASYVQKLIGQPPSKYLPAKF